MADNTTRPTTSGGDVIRSEDESSAKVQVFRLDADRIDARGRRVLPVSGLSASMLEDIRSAKQTRLELLREMQRASTLGAGGPPPPAPIPDVRTIQEILGSKLYRWYRNYAVGTWSCVLGSGDATQGTAANQPTVGTFPISGGTYPVFDGAAGPNDDYLNIPTLSTLPTYTSSDFFIQGGLLNCTSNPDTAGTVFTQGTNDDIVQVNTNNLGFDGTFNSNATFTGAGWKRWIVYMVNATTCNLYVDGVLDQNGIAAAIGNLWRTNTFKIGSNGAGGARLVGSAACMFWGRSSTAFNTNDILALDGALKRFAQ